MCSGSDKPFSLLLSEGGFTVKLRLEWTNMPVHHDINLPTIQSLNNTVIILENSACALLVHVFRCFIKSNFIAKEFKGCACANAGSKKHALNISSSKRRPKKKKTQKDNQTIPRSVHSKQLLKIKAFWRVHGEGTWAGGCGELRSLKSAFQRETNMQVCILAVAVIHLCCCNTGGSPSPYIAIVFNWHECTEMRIITALETAFSSDYWPL